MSRLAGAIQAVREAVASALGVPTHQIDPSDDFVSDLKSTAYDFESLGLIVEEVFCIGCLPDDLFTSSLYRSCEGLAQWTINRADHISWSEARRQRRA